MKTQNGGMLGVDRVGDRGSCAILTRNFPGEEVPSTKTEETEVVGVLSGAIPGYSGGAHSFLAEQCSERPGAVKGAQWARAQRPLTARTALREFPREGMGPTTRSHEQIFMTIGGLPR